MQSNKIIFCLNLIAAQIRLRSWFFVRVGNSLSMSLAWGFTIIFRSSLSLEAEYGAVGSDLTVTS